MTLSTPLLFTILQFLHLFFIDDLTFMVYLTLLRPFFIKPS